MASSKSTSGGIGFVGLLLIAFIVMKLAKIGAVASWSWWWVLSPLWIIPALLIIGFIVYVIYKSATDDSRI